MQTFNIDGQPLDSVAGDQISIHMRDRRMGTAAPYYVAMITWGSVTFTGKIGISGSDKPRIQVPYFSEISPSIDWADIESQHTGNVLFAPVVSVASEHDLHRLQTAAAAWYWEREQAFAEQRANYSARQRRGLTGGTL